MRKGVIMEENGYTKAPQEGYYVPEEPNPGMAVAGMICGILTERQMSFVEFKTNVTSNSEQNIGDKTDDAIAQLWHTYNEIISPRCSSKGISLATSVEIDFFVIFDSNLDVTNTTASRLDKQMEFLEKNKFPLFFDNEKSFI